jgi:TRAP transporter TAXI family solute receptor
MSARAVAAAIVALLLGATAASGEDARPLLIGTGPVVGIYFPAGGAICNMMNRAAGAPVCAVVASEGSAANLEALKAKAIDLAIVQSDWQYHAVTASGTEATGGRFETLRAAFSLHGEPVTIVARGDSGIATLEDLKGKRVNLGMPGSTGRVSAEALLAAMGWSLKDLGTVAELAPEHQPSALCNAHPSGAVAEATQGCGARLVPITGAPAERLVGDNPFYAFTTIPGGTYAGNPDPVQSFGLKATVVTRADVEPERIHALVKAVFEDFPAFTAQHPAFAGLEPEAMAADGNTAPLHEGALRYYQEQGWR